MTAAIASATAVLLESVDIEFERPSTVEEALYVWLHHPKPISPTACTPHARRTSVAAGS
jgi:hypothetical protein